MLTLWNSANTKDFLSKAAKGQDQRQHTIQPSPRHSFLKPLHVCDSLKIMSVLNWYPHRAALVPKRMVSYPFVTLTGNTVHVGAKICLWLRHDMSSHNSRLTHGGYTWKWGCDRISCATPASAQPEILLGISTCLIESVLNRYRHEALVHTLDDLSTFVAFHCRFQLPTLILRCLASSMSGRHLFRKLTHNVEKKRKRPAATELLLRQVKKFFLRSPQILSKTWSVMGWECWPVRKLTPYISLQTESSKETRQFALLPWAMEMKRATSRILCHWRELWAGAVGCAVGGPRGQLNPRRNANARGRQIHLRAAIPDKDLPF